MLLMPFAGFTPLSVISLVTCQLYCKAKHHWEDTAYKTSPTWVKPLFSKSCQDLTPWQVQKHQHHWELLIYTCRLHGGKCAEGMCWGWTEFSTVLSAFSGHLYAGTNLQRQWDLNIGWFASCAWTTNPASQPNIYTAIMLSQKEVQHIPHYTQYCWPVSLNISKRKAILNSSASLSWKINQHIQVYPLLGGKILTPTMSRQSFKSRWSFQILITLLVRDQNEA